MEVGKTSKSFVNKYVLFHKPVVAKKFKDMTQEGDGTLVPWREVESTKTPRT